MLGKQRNFDFYDRHVKGIMWPLLASDFPKIESTSCQHIPAGSPKCVLHPCHATLENEQHPIVNTNLNMVLFQSPAMSNYKQICVDGHATYIQKTLCLDSHF